MTRRRGPPWRHCPRRPQARPQLGLTLLEVLVSVAILAVIATLIYGVFDGMSRARTGIAHIDERYHQGRGALSRMARELESAFLTLHQPLVLSQAVRQTVFLGHDSTSRDRVDFTSFAHRRLNRDAHESDQCEISYFLADDRERDKLDLVRREQTPIDLEPEKGGVIQVLAEDVERFELSYLDGFSGEWTDTWDSSQPAAQFGRLPVQVKITLVLKGVVPDRPLTFMTKVPLAMQTPLSFAVPR